MYYFSKSLSFLFIIALFAYACNNSPEPIKEEIVYDVLPSSKEKFPYKNIGEVIFIDSLNNQCVFEVSALKSQYLTLVTPVLSVDYKAEEDTSFTISTEKYGCYLKCDSLNLEFHVVLSTIANKKSIRQRRVKDELSILTVTGRQGSKSRNRSETQIFYFALDQRNYPTKNNYNLFDKMEILGVQYENVYELDRYSNNIMNILYNHEFGILTFTDEQSNYWCFKEYIVKNSL